MNSSKLLYGLLALAALLLGILAQRWMSGEPSAPPNGASVDSVSLRDLDGNPRDIAEWKGKVLVLNFWATWCAPCREEMPEFTRLQTELGGKGVQFVGIAIDESEAVQDFLKETPVNYPILLGDERAVAWAERLGNRLGVLPFSVVFNRDGQLVDAHIGPFSREQLTEVLKPLVH
ncbi:TlpA family protein disulfide reductase [Methylocaldum szegediense]|uniref:Cytochrome c biogenesis protein CcmG, thiol:disulfide interchange protein DsbE n=1 Tax=Methylocaldum szegediense TaxID=73780 RepID=A0ABM9HZD9_9GAMM|nr:TlpA disulfide reductase family protein [Methylocaldum szegediense]CAI8787780.1 cytochrome c biogenesis protein CcmG, thiol:disulfide interchange protein DsbE [Methylocaldum szegediense]